MAWISVSSTVSMTSVRHARCLEGASGPNANQARCRRNPCKTGLSPPYARRARHVCHAALLS